MNVALDLVLVPVSSNTVTACALRRTHVESGISYSYVGIEPGGEPTQTPYTKEIETGRYEFVACGEWCYVRSVLSGNCGSIEQATWSVLPLAEGRNLYADLKSGRMGGSEHSPIYWGTWTRTEAKVEILGTCETPARCEMFSWGEGANRVCHVNIPAQVGPVLRMSYGKAKALHSFDFTTPDNYRSTRTSFVEIDEKTGIGRTYVKAA
jgi:hypothetical protein